MKMRVGVLAAFAACLCAPAIGQTLKEDEVLSSISVRPLSEPNPVFGADSRAHLAYELLVANPGNVFITIDSLEAVNGKGRSLATFTGENLVQMMKLFHGTGTTIAPGGVANIFMDVAFDRREAIPNSIAARMTITRQSVGMTGSRRRFRPISR